MSSDEERRRSSVDSSDMEALERGITTRVLADRLRTLSQSSGERSSTTTTPGSSRRSSTDSEKRQFSLDGKTRRPSKFLTGTSIPNSVIKSNLNAKEPTEKDPETLRRERDARVSEIIESVLPKHSKRVSYDESRDLEALAKIRRELQKRSSLIHQGSHTRHPNTSNKTSEEGSDDSSSPTSDSEEIAKKQKRRASCRLESFPPLSCNRQPTFESVKKAVENADMTTAVLVNADELAQKATIRRDSAVQGESSESLSHQPTSSFIRRRKFVSKLEKKKSGKAKDSSLEVLQPGINRPSVLLQKSGDIDDDLDEVTILKYPVRGEDDKTNSS